MAEEKLSTDSREEMLAKKEKSRSFPFVSLRVRVTAFSPGNFKL
jgi:hypothetical protein